MQTTEILGELQAGGESTQREENPERASSEEIRGTGDVRRQLIVLIAMANGFVALYLHLWKIGKMGALSCTNGVDCQVVQYSRWGWWMGVDVALWGVIAYGVLSALGLWRMRERESRATRLLVPMLAVATTGVLMTFRLKYGEWFDLKRFCPWCLPSAISMPLLFGLLIAEWRSVSRAISQSVSNAGARITGRGADAK